MRNVVKRQVSKSSLKRGKPSRSERKRALIVCEDAVSAPNYFRKLINHFGLSTVDVKVCGEECGSAPASVVKYGVERLSNDKDFDYVFFVFDRDAHDTYDNALSKINGLKNQKKYKGKIIFYAITSVPCFELWFLLHYSKSASPYGKGKKRLKDKSPADNLINDLKKHAPFEKYSKSTGSNYFNVIKYKMDTAIKNAKYLIQSGKATTDPGRNTGHYDHHFDPSTYIHELVAILKKIADGYKRPDILNKLTGEKYSLYNCAAEVEKDDQLNKEMKDWDVTVSDGLDSD